MRKLIFLVLVLVLGAGLLASFRKDTTVRVSADQTQSGSARPELEYLKAVNSAAPPKDPQLLFLLMGAYANANQQVEGAEFLAARLNEFGPRLSDPQKALYLSAIGLSQLPGPRSAGTTGKITSTAPLNNTPQRQLQLGLNS